MPECLRPRWSHVKERLYPDVVPVLNYLSQSYNLGIIANQGRGLEKRLKSLGILHFFDIVICSEEVGYHKPDRAIFDATLRQLQIPARDCVYIGDRMDNDILPAKKVGMGTVHVLQGIGPHYCQQTAITSDITIQTLNDLLEWL